MVSRGGIAPPPWVCRTQALLLCKRDSNRRPTAGSICPGGQAGVVRVLVHCRSWKGDSATEVMVKITTEQQVRLHASFLTATGHPASIAGVPKWSTADPNIVSIASDPDGKSALVKSLAAGVVSVTVTARASFNGDAREVTGTIDIEVVGAEAERVAVTHDAPEFKTVTLAVTTEALDGARIRLIGHGSPCTTYQVEAASTVGGPYDVIGKATSDADGLVTYIDPMALDILFYRFRWP